MWVLISQYIQRGGRSQHSQLWCQYSHRTVLAALHYLDLLHKISVGVPVLCSS